MDIDRHRIGGTLGIAACSFAAALSFATQAQGATDCYAVDMRGAPLYVTSNVLREAALKIANDRVASARTKGLDRADPPPAPKRCDGANNHLPAAGPNKHNYFGNVVSPLKFLRLAAYQCAGADGQSQFFSMNQAIYYRQCGGGQYSNYIHFWGRANESPSTCFASDYPTMFAKAVKGREKEDLLKAMKRVYSGGLSGTAANDQALGNAMAAILIAESNRDYLVNLENYMLMDLADVNQATPVQIIGGHCVPNAGSCQNRGEKQDGKHPIAWGGAQETMMVNGWGQAAGANSLFGMTFEGNLSAKWAVAKRKVEVASPEVTECAKTFGGLNEDQQNAVKNVFKDILPAP
ncbi:hypothetical protein WJ47_10160 [Burkholderia ubonensis]|uniref:Uncharacterized protein n=1 Tax=Burkholderia ubonensis TaxID=101571 RepID=A0AB73FT38_9BURK|nr:hypothetical protein [Burkholderia ubonensis]KVK72496.1 hypothetical protein WJ44_02215 [Burkholderia ubonensis]KVL68667.1 hypothetical protein WJ47_10160 [Burkholderia ubonensis]KVM20413.1 hypothetical protein WJ53_21975 [Burkholderia ubonensis]KVM23252.1 hypothetical protein WJ54_21090 [Burkholderia ubonensis]KWF07536.1 hypothetical protein WL83_23840 [Burkholderia ubonensis]